MNTKHTPLPWVVSGGIVKTSDGLYNVCDCLISYSLTTSETEANARLIAAAPDLLEALQFAMLERACNAGDAILSGDEWQEFSIKARAAIAKATGEAAP